MFDTVLEYLEKLDPHCMYLNDDINPDSQYLNIINIILNTENLKENEYKIIRDKIKDYLLDYLEDKFYDYLWEDYEIERESDTISKEEKEFFNIYLKKWLNESNEDFGDCNSEDSKILIKIHIKEILSTIKEKLRY